MFTICRDRRPRRSLIHTYKSAEKLFSLPICVKMMWVIKMDELKKRKTPRYQSFDYNSVGVYFITICTQNRRSILSRVVGTGVLDCPQIELTQYGEIADKHIKQLNDFYEHLSVEKYVIMPNHIHFLLWVKEKLKEPIAYALNLYRHSSVFAIRSMAKTFGKLVLTTI